MEQQEHVEQTLPWDETRASQIATTATGVTAWLGPQTPWPQSLRRAEYEDFELAHVGAAASLSSPGDSVGDLSNIDLPVITTVDERGGRPWNEPTIRIGEPRLRKLPIARSADSSSSSARSADHRPHKCYHCRASFTRDSDRRRHESTVHEHAQQIYICGICEYSTSRKDKMLEHCSRRHGSLSDYRCSSEPLSEPKRRGKSSVARDAIINEDDANSKSSAGDSINQTHSSFGTAGESAIASLEASDDNASSRFTHQFDLAHAFTDSIMNSGVAEPQHSRRPELPLGSTASQTPLRPSGWTQNLSFLPGSNSSLDLESCVPFFSESESWFEHTHDLWLAPEDHTLAAPAPTPFKSPAENNQVFASSARPQSLVEGSKVETWTSCKHGHPRNYEKSYCTMGCPALELPTSKEDSALVLAHATGSFACSECNEKFEKPGALRLHQRNHIPHEHRPIRCNLCQEKFLFQKDLKRHYMAKHELGDGAFYCTYSHCRYHTLGFKRRDNLNRHINRVHGESRQSSY